MISFMTESEYFKVKSYGLYKGDKAVLDTSLLQNGDKLRMKVSFTNPQLEKFVVLSVRMFCGGKQTELKAQGQIIFPLDIDYDLFTDEFEVVRTEEPLEIKLSLTRSYDNITDEEEWNFLKGRYIEEASHIDVKVKDLPEIYPEDSSINPTDYLGEYTSAKKLFSGMICFAQDSDGVWIKNAKYKMSGRMLSSDNGYIVPTSIAKLLSGLDFGEGEYVTVRELAEKMGYSCFESNKGLAVVSRQKYDFDCDIYLDRIRLMVRYIAFSRPKAITFERLFDKEKSRSKRIITEESIQKALRLAKTNPKAKKISEMLIQKAEEYFKKEIIQGYEHEGTGVVQIEEYEALMSLYWAYRLTDDRKYADKFKAHIFNMISMPHWNGPFFYLRTSLAMIDCALFYDLFYDELTEEEKEAIGKAIVEKGFMPAKKLYYGGGDPIDWPWPVRRTNWNIVCNSGVVFAAAALYGEYETALCGDMLEKSIQSLEAALIYFAPGGGWFEGASYAGFSGNYIIRACQALEAVFGTCFDLDNAPGEMKSRYLQFYLSANDGKFAVMDTGRGVRLDSSYTQWYAKKQADPSINPLRYLQITREGGGDPSIWDLLWFDENGLEIADIPRDVYYENMEVAMSRSDWTKKGSFLGVAAGDNSAEHAHLDIGTFDFESKGVHFAVDMGLDVESYRVHSYHLLGTIRENYYVVRAEGHNVYVVNPDDKKDQYLFAKTKITPLHSSDDRVVYMVDMKNAYPTKLSMANRYYDLHKGRQVLTVQDEIYSYKENDEFYWFWHTEADVEKVSENEVVLTRKGEKIRVHFDSTVPFDITTSITKPLPTTPSPESELIGIECNLITAHFYSKGEKLIFRATATPFDDEKFTDIVPADKWEL